MISNNGIPTESVGVWHAIYANRVSSPAVVSASANTDRNRWGQRAIAKTALLQRDFSLAKQCMDRIAEKANRRNDLPALARALNESAFIHILMGKVNASDTLYKRAHEIWKFLRIERNSVGFNDYIFFLWDYSVFLRNKGDVEMAQRLEKRLERLTSNLPRTHLNYSRAERLADRGQYVIAEQFYEDAFVEAGTCKDLNMQLRIADRLAPVYKMTGKGDVAEHLMAQKSQLDRARCMSMFSRKREHN